MFIYAYILFYFSCSGEIAKPHFPWKSLNPLCLLCSRNRVGMGFHSLVMWGTRVTLAYFIPLLPLLIQWCFEFLSSLDRLRSFRLFMYHDLNGSSSLWDFVLLLIWYAYFIQLNFNVMHAVKIENMLLQQDYELDIISCISFANCLLC